MRRVLPQRRAAETFTVVCRNQPVTITAGFYDDGTLGEVFITTAKSGADLQNIANDAAVILSLALQHHVNIEVIRHAVTRCNDGSPASILGAVVDCLSARGIEMAVILSMEGLLDCYQPGDRCRLPPRDPDNGGTAA